VILPLYHGGSKKSGKWKGTGELFSIEKTGFSIFAHASYTLALYFLAGGKRGDVHQ